MSVLRLTLRQVLVARLRSLPAVSREPQERQNLPTSRKSSHLRTWEVKHLFSIKRGSGPIEMALAAKSYDVSINSVLKWWKERTGSDELLPDVVNALCPHLSLSKITHF